MYDAFDCNDNCIQDFDIPISFIHSCVWMRLKEIKSKSNQKIVKMKPNGCMVINLSVICALRKCVFSCKSCAKRKSEKSCAKIKPKC